MYDMFHTELDVTEMSVDTETAHNTLVQIQNKLVQLGVEEYYIFGFIMFYHPYYKI